MTHASARDVSQAAASRDAGLARLAALTAALGLAGVIGGGGLAVAMAAAATDSGAQSSDAQAEAPTKLSNEDSPRPVKPAPTRGGAHATSGGS